MIIIRENKLNKNTMPVRINELAKMPPSFTADYFVFKVKYVLKEYPNNVVRYCAEGRESEYVSDVIKKMISFKIM
jgi:hypothetical protein